MHRNSIIAMCLGHAIRSLLILIVRVLIVDLIPVLREVHFLESLIVDYGVAFRSFDRCLELPVLRKAHRNRTHLTSASLAELL